MTRRRQGKTALSSPRSIDRWDAVGFLGFAVAALGALALVGQFSRDGLVVAAVGAAANEIVGRAAPMTAIVALVLGGSVLVAGARRRAVVRWSHVVAALLFVISLAALAALASPEPPPSAADAGGWAGQGVGRGLEVSVGLGPAYAFLGLLAVASLAYTITASPWGIAAIGMAGRAVIASAGLAARGLRRVAIATSTRAAPLFRPRAVGGAEPSAQPDVAPPAPEPQDEVAPEDPSSWEQEPLIRVASAATIDVEAPPSDGRWNLPPIDLLRRGEASADVSTDEIRAKATVIEDSLASFGIEASVAEAIPGPVVTRYLLRPGRGVKVARITALSNDLALKLAARSIRIEAPVPGQPFVGIETPNDDPAIVTLREVMESPAWVSSTARIRVALGKDVAGEVCVADMTGMPHLLIAGATGAGKSVCLTSLVTGLLTQLTPDELQFIMIDPKMVELVTFEGVPHLRMPVVTDLDEVVPVLTWVGNEMARRYRMFNKAEVRNLDAYNAGPMTESGGNRLPYVVVIIDELADLMMTAPGDVERLLARIAQMARATGIHLVISTQRPSVDVLTGLIKANFPTRISFMVSSQADARTILDGVGAERLIGRGDMLYAPPEGGKPRRIQGVFAGDGEIRDIVNHWRDQGEPEVVTTEELRTLREDGPDEEDELFVQATEFVMRTDSVTPDMLSRELRVGRTKALKLAHRLQEEGFVGPPEPQSLRRRVLEREPAE